MIKISQTITIIGGNSWLFKECKEVILSSGFHVIILSHIDVKNCSVIINPVIFSYSKDLKDNLSFLRSVINKTVGKITLISSTAAQVGELTSWYNYPNIKYQSELYLKSHYSNFTIFRIGIILNNKKILNSYCGKVKISDTIVIGRKICDIYEQNISLSIINSFNLVNVKNSKYVFIHKVLLL